MCLKDESLKLHFVFTKNITFEALVYRLLEETHVPKAVSSNPCTVFWMDIFSLLFGVKIVMVGPFLKKNNT